jgi:EpsD family peptidyl-prolyl cis-trans isomerase
MPLSKPLLRPAAAAFGLITLAAMLAACGGGSGNATGTSQVAVKVNDGEISVHQVELQAQRELAVAPSAQASAVMRRTLGSLVDQELAAQAARQKNLDKDPRVVQLMELAKREVLARAWQDQVAVSAREPSSDEIDRYYDANPALFSKRQVYSLQETVVDLPADAAAALTPRIEATTTPAQLADLLRGDNLRTGMRNISSAAEEMPLALLGKVFTLKHGQTLAVPRDGGLRLLTVLDSREAPVDRAAARRPISAYLLNERRGEQIQQGMKQLHEQAKLDYRGNFAALAAPATPASAKAP